MKYLITGGAGFLGSNIANRLLQDDQELIILDNLFRKGSELNLQWLKSKGDFKYFNQDIRNNNTLDKLLKDEKPDVVFHLAGQVAMTTSIENPRLDFEINALGSFNILEAARKYSPESIIVYSSTNKVYGDLEWTRFSETETRYVTPEYPRGFPEKIPLEFHSPYGTSKGAADQYMLDFYRIFGLRTVVFRHSSMYGGRQYSTFDQGWIGWFCEQALKQKTGELNEPFTISGSGKQVRDLLYADDMIDLYIKTAQNIEQVKGKAFNIGGGVDNSLSILELFSILEKELEIELNYNRLPARISDQKVFVADISEISKLINWNPKIDKYQGIGKILEWIKNKSD